MTQIQNSKLMIRRHLFPVLSTPEDPICKAKPSIRGSVLVVEYCNLEIICNLAVFWAPLIHVVRKLL